MEGVCIDTKMQNKTGGCLFLLLQGSSWIPCLSSHTFTLHNEWKERNTILSKGGEPWLTNQGQIYLCQKEENKQHLTKYSAPLKSIF